MDLFQVGKCLGICFDLLNRNSGKVVDVCPSHPAPQALKMCWGPAVPWASHTCCTPAPSLPWGPTPPVSPWSGEAQQILSTALLVQSNSNGTAARGRFQLWLPRRRFVFPFLSVPLLFPENPSLLLCPFSNHCSSQPKPGSDTPRWELCVPAALPGCPCCSSEP